MTLASVKSKPELVRALNQREVSFTGGQEVVNDSDVKSISDRLRKLLSRQKKLHIVILERS
jgi:hypothetical protein